MLFSRSWVFWVVARARLIRFYWADIKINVFHFSLPISDDDIFTLLKLQLKGITMHFFLQATWTKNNYTSYNYEKADCERDKLSLWGKIYTPGAILPPAEHDWLNWSHDKFAQHDCLSWLWCLQMAQSDRQVMWWFQYWQLLAAFCLHCMNCRLIPFFFAYCTCHVTTSTSCVWLKSNVL